MILFLARRLANYLVLCVVAVFLTYVLASLAFDPIALFLHHDPPPGPTVIAAKIRQLHLDQPIPQRFAEWFGGAVHGDFGDDVYGNPINGEVWQRMLTSLRLFGLGTLVGVVAGVLIGMAGAVRQYRITDYVTSFTSFVVIAMPVFVIGTLLKYAAIRINQATGTDVLVFEGEITPGFTGGFAADVLDRLRHLVLPTLSIALGLVAYYSRYQRNTMLDVLGSDFLRTARAKGLRRGRVLYRHGLRTALIPMATLFAYGFSTLIVGGPFTEHIFDWHGMGEWLVTGIGTQDANLTATVTLFTAVCVLASGLLADLAYAALDPRVRI